MWLNSKHLPHTSQSNPSFLLARFLFCPNLFVDLFSVFLRSFFRLVAFSSPVISPFKRGLKTCSAKAIKNLDSSPFGFVSLKDFFPGNRPVMPLMTRDKTGTSRDKTWTSKDKTGTKQGQWGQNRDNRDKQGQNRDKGTKQGK